MGASDLSGSMKFLDRSGYFKDASVQLEISGDNPASFESSLKSGEGKGALSLKGSSAQAKASLEAEKDGSQYKVKLELEKEKSEKMSKTVLESNFNVSEGNLQVSVPSLRIESKEAKGEMFAQFKAEGRFFPKDEPSAQKPANSKFIYAIWEDDLFEMQKRVLENEVLLSVLNNDF
jgi:hypothetical protein